VTDLVSPGPTSLRLPAGDEAELVALARRGDHDAYRVLVRRYETLAFRTAYAVLGSAADAEDAAQEAFVKAYQALGRFRVGSPFRPWLLRIVANEARNRRRSLQRRERLSERLAAEPHPIATIEAHVVAGEERRRLLAAVSALAPDDRLAILARFVLDLSEEETAAVLGVRRATAKMRVFRALRRLRASLEGSEP
jgi:RNA polymerase sigma-70 factor (ECF subfamily)